ncbi:MAG: tRNA (guanosine(37)-N1)-methyltransferase TrmD [Candidatus Paceibacterota bacterium]|jgi:tRNA (guanine37-N1)-methyltransferase
MHFHIITLFPESFASYLDASILARAIKEKKIKTSFYNPRDFVTGKYKKVWPDGNVSRVVDDRPFGGGPGMVMRAEPVLKAVEKILTIRRRASNSFKVKIILFSPSGKKFDTKYAKDLVKKNFTDIILISGRYEGIDARVKKIFKPEEISIGDYVLTGGELPAMVLLDSISRQIPGVLGKYESLEEERVSSSEVYTRPEILEYKGKKYRTPKVLLSGDHKKIEEWKKGK